MRKKTLLLFAIVLILALSCILVSCANKYKGDDFTIEIFDGETSLGKITQDTIKDMDLEDIKISTTNDYGNESTITYTGLPILDCIEKTDITLPTEIENITGFCSDNYGGEKTLLETTTLENTFLAFSGKQDKEDIDENDFPLLILDKNNTMSMYKLKSAISLNINYVTAKENDDDNSENENDTNISDHMQFSISINWENDTTATFEIIDGQGESAKTNIIKVTTPTDGNTSIEIEDKGGDTAIIDLGESKVYQIEKKGTTYNSYKLSDVISWMKFKKSDNEIAIIDDYTKVGFVRSDDENDVDYSTRVFTKNEINNANVYIYFDDGDESNQTRTFADGTVDGEEIENILYRNNLKYITSIIIYQENE